MLPEPENNRKRSSGVVGNDGFDSFELGGRAEGSDVFRGGSRSDTVFAYGPGPLDLSIDGVANDQIVGNPGYGIDNIRLDVENIVGHGNNYTIKGDGDANRLVGTGTDTCKQGPGSGSQSNCEN